MKAAMIQKIYFTTTFRLCDNNGYLSTQICNFFIQNGYELVARPEIADAIVVSTCGFDHSRENRSISIVNQIVKRFGHEKRIIVCGCLPKINPGLFDLSVVTLIGPKELQRFDDLFDSDISIETVSCGRLNSNFITPEYGFLDAYYLQICQGCINNCSYCAIKKAKGSVTSKPLERIIRELESGMRQGFKKIMLLADDCGSYGIDIGKDLADLLDAMRGYDVRLYLNYVEPAGFERLYMKVDPSVFEKIDFMNIPVQSASQRILERMNRHYSVEDICTTLKTLKRQHPHLFLETHVIYGFPSETRTEFFDSFRLTGYYDSIIYFYYTDRKNVRSSFFPEKITSSEMIWRTKKIFSHPLFSREQAESKQSMVLLGYNMGPQALFDSIRADCHNKMQVA